MYFTRPNHAMISVFLTICATGCSERHSDSSKSLYTNEHIVAAELRVVTTNRGPAIAATAKIPLDDSRPIRYFLVVDEKNILSDSESWLPTKPKNSEIQFGIARVSVPFDCLDEKLNSEVVKATEEGNIATLDHIAKSLVGRFSFFYERENDGFSGE